MKGLPEGGSFRVDNRDENHISIQPKASSETRPDYFDISVEARDKKRWATIDLIKLRIEKKPSTVY